MLTIYVRKNLFWKEIAHGLIKTKHLGSLALTFSYLVEGPSPSTESVAKVLCCAGNVLCFETRSSAEAKTKRNAGKSNCIMRRNMA